MSLGKPQGLQLHLPQDLWNAGRDWHKGDAVPLGEGGQWRPGARGGHNQGVSYSEWHTAMQGPTFVLGTCKVCA